MSLEAFVKESNRIEGIQRVRASEVRAHEAFLALTVLTVEALSEFVAAITNPIAELRQHPGMNIRVGPHRPPPGGPLIKYDLEFLLTRISKADIHPYQAHHEYETLHPFMDGNGRSGRALWAWHITAVGRDPFALSFLHRWYYDSLSEGRERNLR